MGLVEEHIGLTNGIMSGELTRNSVENEIKRIESKYGAEAFNHFKVEKRSAPWTQKDLDDLEIQSASGAGSKEFYLYMAEVSDYVHKSSKLHESSTLKKIIDFMSINWWKLVLVILGISAFVWICHQIIG